MRKTTTAALLSVLLCGTAVPETIRMAIFRLEPFLTEAGETSEAGGITVDYWKRFIAPRMGMRLQVLGPFPSKRAEFMLENGEVDTVAQLTKIPEREAVFLYPKTHLTEIRSCISVLPDSPIVSVSKPDDLFDRRIVFMERAYIPPLLKHERISFDLVSYEDYRRTFYNLLFSRRVDAALDINYVSLVHYLRLGGISEKVRIIMLPVEPVKVYSIFRKDEKGRRLAESFDAANADGLKDKIFEKLTRDYLASHPAVP